MTYRNASASSGGMPSGLSRRTADDELPLSDAPSYRRASIDDALQLVQAPARLPRSEIAGYPDEGTRFFALRMLERNPDVDDEFVMYHVLDETGQPVGHVGFHGKPDQRGHVRIGYAIATGARRRGHATKAVRWLVEWCEARSDVAAIDADTDEANEPSRRVLEANGFRLVRVEGDTRFYERAVTGRVDGA